eukprot:TRINITY_DN7417_c0_g1_i3.p1 TRINITY_DN7417_c0_g1~~TRINITY_DN7417_c0_g1_i3.p1  ORF type:complete len:175 (+),score=45.28 TRINITY_DN7417_c0_g1_i3:90-614(+)
MLDETAEEPTDADKPAAHLVTELSRAEESLVLAHAAEDAERWDDFAENMKERVIAGDKMSAEERDMLSAAYKAAIDGRRSSSQIIHDAEKSLRFEGKTEQAEIAAGYRSKINAELTTICDELIELLAVKLIPESEAGESKVFYHKMHGDYIRYKAEVASSKLMLKSAALQAYKE